MFIYLYKIKHSSNLCIQSNHVYQIYLSYWYLYYYCSFLGEHLILADLVRWRWTKFHSDSPVYTNSTVPIKSGYSFLFDVSTDEVAPNLIRNKHWTLFEDRWALRPSSRLFFMCCKRVKSTDVSHKQTMPKRTLNDVQYSVKDDDKSRQKTSIRDVKQTSLDDVKEVDKVDI